MELRQVSLQCMWVYQRIIVCCFLVYRPGQFWKHVTETFTPDEWIDNFRVSKVMFLYLCGKIGPSIERQDTSMRKAISVEQRVGITLWSLATCCEYRTIAALFGVASSTVCFIIHDTCAAIVNVLLKEYISFQRETV